MTAATRSLSDAAAARVALQARRATTDATHGRISSECSTGPLRRTRKGRRALSAARERAPGGQDLRSGCGGPLIEPGWLRLYS